MSGWKDWAVGEVVEESDFQSFVQDQVVQVYDNSGARGSALGTAVAEGMVSYLKDTNLVEVYDGSGWQNFTGDITAVTAGTALTGGGTSGAVTLNVNQNALFTDGTEGFTMVSGGTAGVTYQPISPNYIINGAFDIWQRGTSFTTQLSFTADRYQMVVSTSVTGLSRTVSQESFSPNDLAVLGLGETSFFLRDTVTTIGSATAPRIVNKVEDVRTLANQTATVSVYLKSSSHTTATIQVAQIFGSGGSAAVLASSDSVTISSSWTRVQAQITIPSVAGKTIGAGSHLEVRIVNTAADGAVLDIWGVQLEAGSVATPFRRNANSIQGELAACQRYYWRTQSTGTFTWFANGHVDSATAGSCGMNYPVPMRATPTFGFSGNFRIKSAGTTYATSTIFINFPNTYATRIVGTISGAPTGNGCSLEANNDATAYLELIAEL
jgi:hypothetical protein